MALQGIHTVANGRLSRLLGRGRRRREEILPGPIRGELLGAEQLAERARALAAGQRVTSGATRRRPLLLARLRQTRDLLDEAHERLSKAAADGDVGPAGEWLLDNFHVVQEHLREVDESLPRGYYRELPELGDGPLAGYPRVYEIAVTIIAHTEGRIGLETVELFAYAFQQRTPLSLGELWAVPAMLRLGLIENVRRMALRTMMRLDEVEAADRWATRLRTAQDESRDALGDALNAFVGGHPPLTPIFVSRFLQQLRVADGPFTPLAWLEQWIAEDGLTAEDAAARASERVSLTQVMMANSITSLRAIARMHWHSFVERQSRTEAALRQDPSGDYARMAFETRDRYRHVVERIAKVSGVAEEMVARAAVELARAAHADDSADPRRTHVGFYLVDDGRSELEQRTSYRPTAPERVHRWVLRHPNIVFFGGILAATVGALAAMLEVGGGDERTVWPLLIAFGLVPASQIALSLVNQLVTALLPPRILPKLDFRRRGGIPPEFRTAVAIPVIFDDVDAVRETLEHLEAQFLANRGSNLHFAILSDVADAPVETRAGDDEIIAAVADGVRSLNARYAGGAQDLFYLFHRPRLWNPRQRVWMGWERKRGKLAQFNRFIRGGAGGAFSTVVGDVETIRTVRYVITIDADTVLPPETAALLVGTIAHPLNRASYDPARGCVVRGYGIIQPRVGVSLPSAFRSRFAAIHSGHPGVDPYTTAVSDVYQDLFGEGSFTGKGVYDVDAFERATRGRFPENTLLSHDLIEGNYARAGLATDIQLFDDYPARYLTFIRRVHRWVRGDWQLLPWLGPRVPGPDGLEPNRLSLLSRWKIFDNLRRSTVEITQLLLLVAGWTILPGSPIRWTAAVLTAIAAPWAIALLLALLRPPLDKSWRAYYAAVWEDARTSAKQLALALAFLPHQAVMSADAIARTLWRLAVSRRNLLEWRTASQVERAVSGSAAETWRTMWPAAAAGGVAVLAVVAAGGSAGGWELAATAVPIGTLWLVAPRIAHALNAPAVPREHRLTEAQRAQATRYALLHWRYFERFVNAETQWLAPDNYQEDPAPAVAMRTSPTNIGLQLLATVSACDLGFITPAETADRLERAFRSLERMRRFRGHFYNWYDLRDLSVLEPAYVSTVDSGNLAGHLIALRQACLSLAADAPSPSRAPAAGASVDGELAQRLETLADRAYRYATEMDFGFLFDHERELFAIGYQESTHALDTSHYDLLASEARLASLLAIAKGDVPPEHWFRLSRTLTRSSGETALVSWSGSMFEYLMPLLVMQSFPGTVLDQTYQGAVRRHVAHGAEHGVPWGVSESAYNVRDRHLTYQYRAFGVPDLALKRGLGQDLVIAPYASMLASMVDPERALANLEEIEKLGAVGPWGFRDAIDFTRPEPGKRFALVRNFMAHHVGMSLAALANLLRDRIWRNRFHADPLVRAAELLLHERVPRRLLLQPAQAASTEEALPEPELERPAVREVDTPDTSQPVVAVLGHLPYTLLVTNCGSGYSRYEGLAVTRWRADGTRDATGQFCYVKDVTRGRMWSVAYQPVCAAPDWYRVLLATDRVSFIRVDGDIETRTEIVAVPADAAEVRRVTLTNRSDEPRELELTSYGEVVLAPPEPDRAHPAFGNLFVETEYHGWCTAVTATRRPRAATERRLWFVHVVDTGPERVGAVTCETDRARFLGRGRSPADPVALERDGPLGGTTGAVLDPIVALRTRVRLERGQSAAVTFTTIVATTPERAFQLADRYHDPHAAQRALDLAWTAAQIELRELAVTPADAAVYQELAGHLFYAHPGLRVPEEELLRCRGAQPLLWAQGISGDWPILLATIGSPEGLPTLRQLLAAHQYWRRRGMTVDLVVVDEKPSTYLGAVHERLMSLLLASSEGGTLDQSGGVFIRRRDQLGDDGFLMLRATARVYIECDGRHLARHLADADARGAVRLEEPDDWNAAAEMPYRASSRVTPKATRVLRRLRSLARAGRGDGAAGARRSPAQEPRARTDGTGEPARPVDHRRASGDDGPVLLDNGLGGLARDGDYEIRLTEGRLPPAPWANVIANRRGGFLVTERGTSCTWAENAQMYRLTPWHNDPVSDPASDVLYLRDEESGAVWSPTPAPYAGAPAGEDAPSFVVRHGAGASTFECERFGLATHLTVGMAGDEPVKVSLLRLTNLDERPRRISVTAYVEWCLGVLREHTQHHVRTWFEPELAGIFARNSFEPQFADWVAFCALSETATEHTGDRREFLGRNGSADDPAAMRAGSLSGATGAGLDPCAALRCTIELAPGQSRELVIVLGAAPSETAARQAAAYRELGRAKFALAQSRNGWEERLSVVRVRTPEPSFDAMVNRWALYQALSCRMWGRAALYQSSGAYGFRDQLQDAMAFVYAEPGVAREHILRAASRQFIEGDVQHWWHPPAGRGVRTRFSDDLAWLPYVVDHYIRVTADAGLLDEEVPFITMRPLEPHEHELFDLPQVADERASLYEHCLRALRKACTAGAHGLPLIGIGDWNDGMNRVGVAGQGESVWLAWFLIATLRSFAEHADARGDATVAGELRQRADAYLAAVEEHGWDGAWYRRAYFDDGTALGSAQNDECRIDSIAQSWSVISGAGDAARQERAMRSLEEHLVREDARLITLLTPPFDKTPNDPGYIKGYLPGVRENGAQYTHAALWTVLATALRGDGDRAFELYQMLNPLMHARTQEEIETYKVEPYVVAADVYTAAGHLGRGGWTWYTGSASWMYRVGLEAILGFTKRGDTLTIAPCVPRDWPELTIEYRFGRSLYVIVVREPGEVRAGAAEVTVDGRAVEAAVIPLVDDGLRHDVVVTARREAPVDAGAAPTSDRATGG